MNQVESFVEVINWKYCMDWLIDWHFIDKIELYIFTTHFCSVRLLKYM